MTAPVSMMAGIILLINSEMLMDLLNVLQHIKIYQQLPINGEQNQYSNLEKLNGYLNRI